MKILVCCGFFISIMLFSCKQKKVCSDVYDASVKFTDKEVVRNPDSSLANIVYRSGCLVKIDTYGANGLREEIIYDNKLQLHGPSKKYLENGSVSAIYEYEHGKKKALITFMENGDTLSYAKYDHDTLVYLNMYAH